MEKQLRVTAHDGFPTLVDNSQLENYLGMNERKDADKRFVLEWVEVDEDGVEVEGGKVELIKGSATPKVDTAAVVSENEKLKAELEELRNQKSPAPAKEAAPAKGGK